MGATPNFHRRCAGGLVAAAAAVAIVACSRGQGGDAPPEPASASSASSVTRASDGPCGAVGETDCPLQGWMKATMGPAMTASDVVRLERAFRRVGEMAPPGYASWRAIAGSGADAASKGDVEAARRACKACHGEHRARYRLELRARALL